MLKLLAIMFALATSITYLDAEMPGGTITLLGLFSYLLVVQALINLATSKFGRRLPERIKSRGIETLALFLFYSFINGVLITVFSEVTNLITFSNVQEPFFVAGSMMLIRQLFD
jgi:hypothetical protein